MDTNNKRVFTIACRNGVAILTDSKVNKNTGKGLFPFEIYLSNSIFCYLHINRICLECAISIKFYHSMRTS